MSHRLHRLVGHLLFTAVGVGCVVGCNAILDNKPGTLSQDETGELPTLPTDGDETDAGTTTPPKTDAGLAPSEDCQPGQRKCNAQCVFETDPVYGCGAADCSPCKLAHATAGCAANACTVVTCDPGYGDCDGDSSNGCETDLSKATSCGACNAVCPAAAPLCAPSANDSTFTCSTGCTPSAPLLCGKECVDPLTSPTHCGGCNTACPAVANATSTCTAGNCGFTCKTGYHACQAAHSCAADTDVTACGATCTICPVPAHSVATCTAGACGMGACAAGYGNCNANAADGCEAVFATDHDHCGNCTTACTAAQVCTNGLCVAKPDAGP